MKLLLDTPVFIWWWRDSRKLGAAARRAIVTHDASFQGNAVPLLKA